MLCLAVPQTETSRAGFMGMPHDRTGLRHHANHQWVFLSGMQPGDVLLFRYTWKARAVLYLGI
jgi:hypothetical protein